MPDINDPFNTISGTGGLMGAADTIFVFCKKMREDKEAYLHMTGRDIEANSLVITFDSNDSCKWKVVESISTRQERTAREEYEIDPIVKLIKELLKESPEGFKITAKEFNKKLPDKFKESAEKIGRKFKNLEESLKYYDRIIYKAGDTKTRRHSFIKITATTASTATSATTATTATSK